MGVEDRYLDLNLNKDLSGIIKRIRDLGLQLSFAHNWIYLTYGEGWQSKNYHTFMTSSKFLRFRTKIGIRL